MPVVNNMENVQSSAGKLRLCSKPQIFEKMKKSGLREYGFHSNMLIADKWASGFRTDVREKKVTCALDNNDGEKLLISVFKDKTSEVLQGLAVAAYVTEADSMEVLLPENSQELAENIMKTAAAAGLEVSVREGMADLRSEKDSIIHHPVSLAVMYSYLLNQKEFTLTLPIFLRQAGEETAAQMEISYGTKLGDLLTAEMKEGIKAVSVGTRLYTADVAEIVIDENFPLGNGVITIYGSKNCIADQSVKAAMQMVHLSCGKCTFCREGTIQIYSLLKEIVLGKGAPDTIPLIREIGSAMQYTSLCSIGRTASDFALGAVNLFGGEMEDHIRRRSCHAQVCSAFMNIYINPQACTGCEECADVCPESCIEGKSGYIHMIDEFDCTKCGKCIEVCPEEAILRTSGRLPKLPEKLTKAGRFKRK